jgi:hypothetical protein
MAADGRLITPWSMRDRVCLREADVGILLRGALSLGAQAAWQDASADFRAALRGLVDVQSILDGPLDEENVVLLTCTGQHPALGRGVEGEYGGVRGSDGGDGDADEVARDLWVADASKQTLHSYRGGGSCENKSMLRELKSLYKNLVSKVPVLLALLADFDRVVTCERLQENYVSQVEFIVGALKGQRAGTPVGTEEQVQQQMSGLCEREFLYCSQFYGTVGGATAVGNDEGHYTEVTARLEDFPEYRELVLRKKPKLVTAGGGEGSGAMNPLALLMKSVFPTSLIKTKR